VLDSGAQVDDTLGKEIMESVILEQTEENIIFDGFIRNDWNKEIFDRILPDYQVIWFQLPEEKAIDRLLGRMYDPKT
jgi:adenylate kinase family enzyme